MRVDTDVEALARQYARQTRRRMALAITELDVMNRVGLGDTHRLSGWLEVQEKASRAAGFVGIARLCETVNECLAGLRRGEQPVLVPLVGTLQEVCRTVALHAEAVAKSLRRGAAHRADSPSPHASGRTSPVIPAGATKVSAQQ